MIFVGDTHGERSIRTIADKYAGQTVYSVGDIGIGFPYSEEIPSNVKFIRGNHDSPYAAKNHPNYLGDFGVLEVGKHRMFYISGAHSVDWRDRTPEIDWWEAEQLTQMQFDEAKKLYREAKPTIVLSHDAPAFLSEFLLQACQITRPNGFGTIPSRTSINLHHMFLDNYEFSPKYWIFGHWHVSTQYLHRSRQTRFVCLDIDETFEIPE